MIRSVFLICVANAPPSHISSSRSLFISGTQASIFYSSEAYPTRMSVPFARSLKHRSQISGALVPLSITAATSTGAFTTVVDALVDSLCEEDVVLGKDWIDVCASNNVLCRSSSNISNITVCPSHIYHKIMPHSESSSSSSRNC